MNPASDVQPVQRAVQATVQAETAQWRGLCSLCSENHRARVGAPAHTHPRAHPRAGVGGCLHTLHTLHNRAAMRVHGMRSLHTSLHATPHSHVPSRAALPTLVARKEMDGDHSMCSAGRQLDLVRHGDAALARAHREAAKTALRNPFESRQACERRARHHLAEAARLDRKGGRA